MKRFIVIEGCDGSGKDTQARLIKEKYESEGSVIIRSHPESDNMWGRKSKECLESSGTFKFIIATLCYGIDAIRSIIKYYKKADTVIIVRYTLAVAYLPNIISKPVYKIVCFLLPVSEYMFYLDISPEESLARIKKRGEEEEMFENYDALVKTRKKADAVLYNWNVIPADEPSDIVFSKIDKILNELDAKNSLK